MLLFTSSLRTDKEIPQSEIEQLPSYAQFSESIAKEEVSLGDAGTQQKIGFIFLKMIES